MISWLFRRRESASNERMAEAVDAMAKAQEIVRSKRLALEEVIADMQKDREHARGK
jgi:hypothetical protein